MLNHLQGTVKQVSLSQPVSRTKILCLLVTISLYLQILRIISDSYRSRAMDKSYGYAIIGSLERLSKTDPLVLGSYNLQTTPCLLVNLINRVRCSHTCQTSSKIHHAFHHLLIEINFIIWSSYIYIVLMALLYYLILH